MLLSGYWAMSITHYLPSGIKEHHVRPVLHLFSDRNAASRHDEKYPDILWKLAVNPIWISAEGGKQG